MPASDPCVRIPECGHDEHEHWKAPRPPRCGGCEREESIKPGKKNMARIRHYHQSTAEKAKFG